MNKLKPAINSSKVNLLAFWQGLTQPSIIAISLCCSIIIIAIFIYSIFAIPANVAKWHTFLAQDKKDSYAKVSGKTLAIALSSEIKPKLQVIFLGASATREAVLTDDVLSAKLTKISGKPIDVISLLSSGQTLWESAAILEKIAPKIHGVVWIEVNPLRMVRGTKHLNKIIQQPRLGFRSTLLDNYAKEYGIENTNRSNGYGWDNRGFVLVRMPDLLKNLIFGAIQFERHRYNGHSTMSTSDLIGQIPSIEAELTDYDKKANSSLKILTDILASINPNIRIGLLESPINPILVSKVIGSEFYNRHISKMHSFATQHNIPYYSLETLSASQPESFFDWFHIHSAKTRLQITENLSKVTTNFLLNNSFSREMP